MVDSSAPAPALAPHSSNDRAGLAGLARAFFALVGLTTALIVLGALVRSHEAGLACPDWPLCFGEVIPEMNFSVAFEWSHRLLAGGVSAIFAVLALQVLRRGDAPLGARRLLGLATALLVVQILLGALTVWLLLASWTVTAHLITGNSFCVTLLLIGCCLRDAARPPPARGPVPPLAGALVIASAVVLLAQLVLGGLVASSFAGLACPEWPTCNGGLWFPTWSGNVGLHLVHRMNGYVLVTLLAVSATLNRRDPSLRRWTLLALAIGLCEALAGIFNVRLGIPVEVTGLHSALAAALALTLAVAVRDLFGRTTRAV